jgi:hypothetical protein
MPRSACMRATARLTVKWLDHKYHHRRSDKTLRTIELLTHENFTTVDALEFHTVFNDELAERHRRHMLLRAWMQVKLRGYVQ